MESHEPDLRSEINDEEKIRQIQEDYTEADLKNEHVTLLDFAKKLTFHPDQMSEGDVSELNEAGYSDKAVVEAVQLIGYFNYINRVIDGLGAEPEPEMRFDNE